MNERDKALGRLLLARNQVARETLHQAAAMTEARRAAGQQVEVVAVLVEMGALPTDAARAVWAEVAHVPPVPGGPPSGTFQRVQPALQPVQPTFPPQQYQPQPVQPTFPPPAQPTFPPPAQPTFPGRAATPPAGVPRRPGFPTGQRPAPMLSGEGDFSPVSTLSTMGEAPPQLPAGHDPLRSSRTMAAVPPSAQPIFPPPAHLPPPARLAAPQAAHPMAGLGGPPPGTFPPNTYLAAPGKATILDPPPATPSFGPGHPPNGANGSHLFASGGFPVNPAFGGASSGFGGGYSTAPVPLPPSEDLSAPFDAGGATLGLPPGHAAALAGSPAPLQSPGFASYPAPAAIGTPVAPAPAAVLGPEIPLGEAAAAPPSPSPDGKKKRGTSARLGPQGKKAKAAAAPARPGSNATLILGGAACVAFLIVAGVAFAVRGGQAPTGAPPAATSSAPPKPSTPVAGGETEEAPPEPSTAPVRPRPKPPAEQGQRSLGLQSTPIQAEKDDASQRWADELLAQASVLQDQEKYDEGLTTLDKFPEDMRAGEGYARVQKVRARLQLYASFKRRLDDALKEGPTSMNLKKLVARLEGGTLEEEVKQLPCVARFEEEARKVLGDAAYNEIAVKAVDLDDLEEKE